MNGEKLDSTKKSRQYQSLTEKLERRKKQNTPPPDPGDEPLKEEPIAENEPETNTENT